VETQKHQKRIVYFEDDLDMIELVRIILSREGFQIDGISEGESGLNLVRNTQPDLVLLDLMLPDMDGWEVFRQLKQDEETEAIPVMVVTAKSQSIDKILGIEIAKVDEYISKPFRPQELVELVNRVLTQAEK
jgi:two-component system response regulator VicR